MDIIKYESDVIRLYNLRLRWANKDFTVTNTKEDPHFI